MGWTTHGNREGSEGSTRAREIRKMEMKNTGRVEQCGGGRREEGI